MRRTIVMVILAACGGFCLASATAFATTKFNIWKTYGEKFQLGYVVGYLDAVQLMQRKDVRAQVPTGGGKNFDRWVRDVNAFYEDPANANRPVPDAMQVVGNKIRDEWLREWERRTQAKPSPLPTPGP